MKKELTVQDWGRMIGQKILFKLYEEVVFKLRSPYFDKLGNLMLEKSKGNEFNSNFCKPILRRLKDITEKEIEEFKKEFLNNYDNYNRIVGTVFNKTYFRIVFIDKSGSLPIDDDCWSYFIEHFDWLESKGFDIRDWIDAGLAIDANEVEK
jgi:hypothetical protein